MGDIEYAIQGNYGQGWEDVTAESTPEAAEEMLATYNVEEPQYPHRILPRPADD